MKHSGKLQGEQAAQHALRAISAELPGAEEYVMVHHPAFRVGKKPFAIAGERRALSEERAVRAARLPRAARSARNEQSAARVLLPMQVETSLATVSINLGPEAQAHLLGDERFSKTPYLGQHGWVTVDLNVLSKSELAALVTDSYRRIAGKKLLAQLDGAQPNGAKKPKRYARKP